MGLLRTIAALPLFFSSPIFCTDHPPSFQQKNINPKAALFLYHKGETDQAIELIIQALEANVMPDYSIIQSICKGIILDLGVSRQPESFLAALYGASLSGNVDFLPLLKRGLDSPNPGIQLAALQLFHFFPEEHVKELLEEALGSPYLVIRMEAINILAMSKAKEATSQILSFMYKTPSELEPLFPQFFAHIGNTESQSILKKLLSSPNKDTRVQTILAIANYGRDDLLPDLYRIASHTSPEEIEACCYAFGRFKDRAAKEILLRHIDSNLPFIRLNAAWALYQMGSQEAYKLVEKMALSGNPFAIQLLGYSPSASSVLETCFTKFSGDQKFNAAISLMRLKSDFSADYIAKILSTDQDNIGIEKVPSPTGALSYWSMTVAASEAWKSKPDKLLYSQHYRNLLLSEAIDLPENAFFDVIKTIALSTESELIPTLMQLLENRQSQKTKDLLSEYAKSYTNPFLRINSFIALIRSGETHPYLSELKEWITDYQSHPAIQFFTPTPSTVEPLDTLFTLTPKETSQLLINAFIILANEPSNANILTLLKALKNGVKINRPVLAGIILKATE